MTARLPDSAVLPSPIADAAAGLAFVAGEVMHRRTRPVANAFTYPAFCLRLPLSRLSALAGSGVRWNRRGLVSFHDRDHGPRDGQPLEPWMRGILAREGIAADGEIVLHAFPRMLGYAFNPVSFWVCHDAAGAVRAVLAEVNNTFGGSHNYWLRPDPASRTFRSAAEKSLYVSPFMPPDLDYAFAFSRPADRLVAHMESRRNGSIIFDATLSLERRPWTAREIRRTLLRHPAMTAVVIAGIHWQALRLWWKGVPLVPRLTPDGAHPTERGA